MGILANIVEDNKFTPEHVKWFDAKLFFEGDNRRLNYKQFGVLLFLSTVIATYDVLGDSTATVIGAMIIAPLMTPIMATAAALGAAIIAIPLAAISIQVARESITENVTKRLAQDWTGGTEYDVSTSSINYVFKPRA